MKVLGMETVSTVREESVHGSLKTTFFTYSFNTNLLNKCCVPGTIQGPLTQS